MTEQDQAQQPTPDAANEEKPAPLTDWEKLEALEEQERKKTSDPDSVDEPSFGPPAPKTLI